MPSGKELFFAAKLMSQTKEYLKIAERLSRRRDSCVYFAHAAFGVGVSSLLLSPSSRRQNEMRKLGGRRGMEAVLHYEKFQLGKRLFQHTVFGNETSGLVAIIHKRPNALLQYSIDDVRICETARRGDTLNRNSPDAR